MSLRAVLVAASTIVLAGCPALLSDDFRVSGGAAGDGATSGDAIAGDDTSDSAGDDAGDGTATGAEPIEAGPGDSGPVDTGAPDVGDGCVWTTHQNGMAGTWQDCAPLGTYDHAEALAACVVHTGSATVCIDDTLGGGSMCVRDMDSCPHWWEYVGPQVGVVVSCVDAGAWR